MSQLEKPRYPAQKTWQTERAAAGYRRKRDPSRYHRHDREEAIIRSWLVQLPKTGRVLDVPCGTGRMVSTVTALGLRYTGGDISQAMIDQARQASDSPLVEQFVHTDVASLPFENNSFDCVIIWRLLHHIRDASVRQAMLREAARVSRGMVLISFHHPVSFTFLRKLAGRLVRGGDLRMPEFTEGHLRREATTCGLNLVETRGFRKFVSINWFARLAKV